MNRRLLAALTALALAAAGCQPKPNPPPNVEPHKQAAALDPNTEVTSPLRRKG